MHIKIDEKTRKKLYLTVLTGVLAGFLNGFLGAGSGVILLFAIAALNCDKSDGAARDNFATVVACVIPMCIVSIIIYIKEGAASGELVGRFIPSAVIGGLIGAVLTDRLNTNLLRIVFSVVVIIAGFNMVF